MKRRTFFLTMAGAGAAAASEVPVYFNFFSSPVRHDRYLRNLREMESLRTVREPSLHGEYSLEMLLRFSEKHRNGELLWDLAPRRISRVRFSLFNPNPARIRIDFDMRFFDVDGRFWRLKNTIGREPLERNWQTFEFSLFDDAVVTQGPETIPPAGLDGIFQRFILNFSIPKDRPLPADPVLLYLDGMELF